jgi:prevent-host-death family protein
MKTVSVRELQQNIKSVLERVERGEVIQVTRHRRLVARLMPAGARKGEVQWPDLEKRAKRVFGDRVVDPPPSLQVSEDRGSR